MKLLREMMSEEQKMQMFSSSIEEISSNDYFSIYLSAFSVNYILPSAHRVLFTSDIYRRNLFIRIVGRKIISVDFFSLRKQTFF